MSEKVLYNLEHSLYRPLLHGGRIKTAGASLNSLYEAAEPLRQEPDSVDAAVEANRQFTALRKSPSEGMRKAFFPLDTAAMKTAFSGPGIYRPTIKTDQGPAGNFAPFYNGNGVTRLEGTITEEQGVAVVERFFKERLQSARLSPEESSVILDHIRQVQEGYYQGDYRHAYTSLMDIRTFGQERGIQTTRRAGVGRSEFFFCRPVATETTVEVGSELVANIADVTTDLVIKIEQQAAIAKRLVSKGLAVSDAVSLVQEGYQFDTTVPKESSLLYFQPDVLIRNDGTFDIEKINFPDLGMFITQVESHPENGLLKEVQGINSAIQADVVKTVAAASSDTVLLVTRDEVIENNEDSLEHLELQALAKALTEKGKKVRAVPITSYVSERSSNQTGILLNLSTQVASYQQLLHAYADGVLRCYPNPFIRLFENEATTFPRRTITEPTLSKFLSLLQPSAMDKPKGIFEKGRLIDQALTRGGTDGDIIYFSLPGISSVQIPTFRYDPKSFIEVAKAVRRAEDAGQIVDRLHVTSVPFAPEDAVMKGDDGPRLAVFRFMFVKNEV